MQLDCVSQTFHEPVLVERLAEKADRSVIECTSPVFVVWVCGNQNHRHLISPRPQRFLQLKPALSGHLQVSDQACRLREHARREEMLSRFESNGFVSQGFHKLAYALAGQQSSSTIEINGTSDIPPSEGTSHNQAVNEITIRI